MLVLNAFYFFETLHFVDFLLPAILLRDLFYCKCEIIRFVEITQPLLTQTEKFK